MDFMTKPLTPQTMPSKLKSTSLSILIMILLGSVFLQKARASEECDSRVRRLRTRHSSGISLCEIQHRVSKAYRRISQLGVKEPHHLGNIFAPRFIKRQDWKNYLAKNGDQPDAAWKVYSPAPQTWRNWATLAAFAEGINQQELNNYTREDLLKLIKKMHRTAMGRLLNSKDIGQFRTRVPEIIPLHSIDNAYTVDEIRAISETPFVSKRTNEKLMKFSPLICSEGVSRKSLIYKGIFFKVADGATVSPHKSRTPYKSCGDLTMAPPEEVLEQMELWSEYFLSGLKNLQSQPETIDIIAFAAYLQQWFAVIHPFIDGNGRLSRMIMDIVFNMVGLPAPILDNVENDFFYSPSKWADEIGKGLLNTMEIIESCSTNFKSMGCREVADISVYQGN